MIRLELDCYLDGSPNHQGIWFYSIVPERWEYTDFWGEVQTTDIASTCKLDIGLHGYASIINMTTKPRFYRQGHARRILSVAIEYARQSGVSILWLGVQGGRENIAAWNLYTSLGFIHIPETFARMEKRL